MQQIEQWEANNYPIPMPFKTFLLEYNCGEVTDEKNVFNIPKMKNESILRQFFGIYEGIGSLDYVHRTFTSRNRFPAHYFAIGSDMLGNLILMGQAEKNFGQIYYWDHENEVDDGKKPHEKNIYKVAKDLNSFIDGLYIFEDDDDDSRPIEKLYDGSDSELKKLLETDFDVNIPDEYRHTLIIKAVIKNKIWLVEELISRKANLSGALEKAIYTKRLEIAELLLKAGADIEECASSTYSKTPLQLAVISNRPEFVALFLKYGANKNIKDKFERTPLDIAIMKNGKQDVDNSIIDMSAIITMLSE
ncbi:MAG: SMI1/KNR4 family protein [Bacteroidia bacterium]